MKYYEPCSNNIGNVLQHSKWRPKCQGLYTLLLELWQRYMKMDITLRMDFWSKVNMGMWVIFIALSPCSYCTMPLTINALPKKDYVIVGLIQLSLHGKKYYQFPLLVTILYYIIGPRIKIQQILKEHLIMCCKLYQAPFIELWAKPGMSHLLEVTYLSEEVLKTCWIIKIPHRIYSTKEKYTKLSLITNNGSVWSS